MRKCYIICASSIYGYDLTKIKDGFIIAVDGGYAHLLKANITPNIIIGDFDSLGYIPNETNVIILCTDKDETDTFVAIEYAKEEGYKEIDIIGGSGGRIDHTFANVSLLLHYAKLGLRIRLITEENIVTVIYNDEIVFDSTMKGYISVLACTDVCSGVEIVGLKYTLKDATLTNDIPLGCSNEFTSQESKISVNGGGLLIITES